MVMGLPLALRRGASLPGALAAASKIAPMPSPILPERVLRPRSQPLPWLVASCLLLPVLARADCGDAPRAGVDWHQCEKNRLILRGANLQGAKLSETALNGSDFAKANLAGADLTRASVERARFSDASLERAKLVRLIGYRTNFSEARMAGVDLTKAELMRSIFKSAAMPNANLEKAELQRATMDSANLTGANFSGADLARTSLLKATLRGARFTQARMFLTRIEGVDLSAVQGLTQAQLDTTCGNAQTRLPAGLKPSQHWPCGADD